MGEKGEKPSVYLARVPTWWYRGVNDAVPLMKRDHGVAEAVLGISREVEKGNLIEARRLFEELRNGQMALLSSDPNCQGELGSSQVKTMLDSDQYPEPMKEIVRKAIDA